MSKLTQIGLHRRSFIKGTACALGAVCASSALSGCGGSDVTQASAQAKAIVTLPAVSTGTITVDLTENVMLSLTKINGWVIGKSDGLADKLIILRSGESEIIVASAICTHANCTVAYNGLNDTFDCPCHASSFEASDGTVVGGPAPAPLKMYKSNFDGTRLVISVV